MAFVRHEDHGASEVKQIVALTPLASVPRDPDLGIRMQHDFEMKPATKVIHGGQEVEATTGAVMPPIFTSTTYAQESPGVHKGMDYIRAQNPTRYALERMLANLEGSGISRDVDETEGGFAFSSGCAATGSLFDLVPAGSHVVAMDDLYGGTHRLLSQVRQTSQNLKLSYIDLTQTDSLAEAMTAETRLVWVETPTNPNLKIADLARIAEIAKKKNPDVILACDNTFASPINQRPLELGFNVVMHSATKYLGGHSDVLAGILVTNKPELAERIRFVQKSLGAVLGPFDSYLLLRGIKTLAIRIERHNASSLKIAKWLEAHPKIDRVVHPGLESHPQHAIAKKQMDGFGGMITMFIKGGLDEARTMLERVRIFALAESLGGVESLIEHPAIMTHASLPADKRAELGISDTLIRLSVGIEDVDDLIGDLEQALK